MSMRNRSFWLKDDRYKDIIDTADSGEIDYDGMEVTATKPTKAAIRVNLLNLKPSVIPPLLGQHFPGHALPIVIRIWIRHIAWEVLTKQGWYDRWLQVEKDFALARYKDIIDTAE
jgi:hypothetical protein